LLYWTHPHKQLRSHNHHSTATVNSLLPPDVLQSHGFCPYGAVRQSETEASS